MSKRAAGPDTPPPPAPDPPGRSWQLPREGYCWLGAAVATLAVGLFKGINLLVLLGYVLLAVLALSAAAAGWRLRGLRARRHVGGPVFAGAPCGVDVLVSKEGRGRWPGVRIEDRGPDHALEWFASGLEAGGSQSLRGQVVLPRRGRYAWGPLAAVSGAPFGLVRRRAELIPAGEVLVLPRLGSLHAGRLRQYLTGPAREGSRLRRRPVRHAGARAEFHGLRPFRPGDSPRSIHWRTSARCGEWMVREFEDVPGDDLLLVFDPSLPPRMQNAECRMQNGKPGGTSILPSAFCIPHFEGAISLAATVCWEWGHRPGDRLVAVVAGPEPLVLSGAGAAHARRVLEALAVQGPEAGGAGPALLARLAASEMPPAAVLLVSAAGSDLAGPLRQVLNRPVRCLEGAALGEIDFYRAPEEP